MMCRRGRRRARQGLGEVLEPLPLPEQFADNIRTDVTRTCCTFALASEPDVPATAVVELLRARREARWVGGGSTMPESSTRWPTWLARSSPCSMYDELPDAPKLASFAPLALRDVAPGEVDAPAPLEAEELRVPAELVAVAGDEVSPDATVALDSMNDGAMVALPRVDREVPVVAVAPVVPLPVVPTVAL